MIPPIIDSTERAMHRPRAKLEQVMAALGLLQGQKVT